MSCWKQDWSFANAVLTILVLRLECCDRIRNILLLLIPQLFWQAINSYDKSQSFMRKDLSYLYFCVSSEKCSMLRDENFKSNLKCNLSLLKWEPWKASGSSFDSCRTVHLCFAYYDMWSTNLCARFSEAHGWLISDEISHPCASFNLTHLKSRNSLSVRL